MDNKDLLEGSVIVEHVVVKLISSSTNSHDHVVLFKSAREFVSSDQVEVVILWVLDDRNSDVIVSDNLLNLMVESVVLSGFELDWGGLE